MADNSAERAAQLRSAVKEKYSAVSHEPQGRFPYPVGRESLERLGYDKELLARVPPEVVARFVGVGNPFSIRPVQTGERILDIGCGCGLDSFIAAMLAGPEGRVVGLDITREMLAWARSAQAAAGVANLSFYEGSAEALPFEDESFDVVLSNGVLNLVPDKDIALREIARVLNPGGNMVAADLVVVETIPEQTLCSMDAWST